MRRTPLRIITTSWDDGHKADLKLARLLSAHGMPGTFYISPHNREIAPDERLTDQDVLGLGQQFEIGAHTMTHPVLTQVPLEEAREEIVGSKVYLEELLGKPVDMFCYPRGAFNAGIRDGVEQAGFLGARTVQPYQTGVPADWFAWGATSHAFPTHANYAFRLALMNNPRFVPIVTTKDWVKSALQTLEQVRVHGGVWHLWGHSWELEQVDLWDGLATVLKAASKQKDFQYMTNGELVEYAKGRDV